MIYLGEQKEALEAYKKEAVCWLNIKLQGRKSSRNPQGHRCSAKDCAVCNHTNKNNSVNNEFRALFNNTVIEDIIIGNPEKLIQIYNTLELSYIPPNGSTEDSFKEQSKKLFVLSGYENWFQSKNWNYRLANLLNRHTCTYCNREYIFVLKNQKGGKGMVPQFDHWYNQNKYPLLAISFYNLIPSCSNCNTIKSEAEMSLAQYLHPYANPEISSSYRFDYWLEAVHKPKIIFKDNGLTFGKGANTVRALNLPLMYEGHSKKELQDLYDLRFKYSDNYLKILMEKTFSKKINMSDQEKYRLIFGIEIDEENYHKRTMSKFKKDIISKLLSIKN